MLAPLPPLRPDPRRAIGTTPLGLSSPAASVIGLVAAIWLATRIDAGPVLHEIALFLHLAALVVGFGAVLAIDWIGLAWLRGQAELADVLTTATRLTTPIWLGLGGLVATGMFLGPDPTSSRTQSKLALVVLLTLNGHAVRVVHARLLAAGPSPSRPLLVRAWTSTAVSQIAWWGASIIGFLTARS